MYTYDDYKNAADFIREKTTYEPKIAIVLGSGLNVFAEKITNKIVIKYSDIPNFPTSTVVGHSGELIIGEIDGVQVVVLSGRFHVYEGYSMEQVAFYVRVLKLFGVEKLILTNAAGSINSEYEVGDFMLIADHIKLVLDNPLRGKNIDEFGARFNDMTNTYTKALREKARVVAGKLGIDVKQGVYAYMSGPCFETPAEIRMLRVLGADAVGMSTVAEAIVACHCDMQILGISFITNMGAGMLDCPIRHNEVIEAADNGKDIFCEFLKNIILEIQ